MTIYKFLWGCRTIEISAESPRNAVLKFRQSFDKSQWDIWFVAPKMNTFIAFRDFYIYEDKEALYYDCEVKPVH